MERDEAVVKLETLRWKNLVCVANELQVEIFKNGNLNKGWAGITVERYLGIQQNTSRDPNLGSWELKVVPVTKSSDGHLRVKETMAITMLDPHNIVQTPFEDSHLFTKLRRIVAVTRLYSDPNETESIILELNEFQLEGTELYDCIVEDYKAIQKAVSNNTVSGRIGQFVQPRTKGAGHGSTSRAFYARKQLVEYVIGLKKPKSRPQQSSPQIDCPRHSGKRNNTARQDLDGIMTGLHPNQSGKGRHKCPYCAYQAGFQAGIAAGSSLREDKIEQSIKQ